MKTRTGVILFAVFMIVFIGGGIALFGDSGGTSPSQLQAQNTTTSTTSTFDNSLYEYSQTMADISSNLSYFSSNLSSLMGNMNPYSDDWTFSVALNIAGLRSLYEEILTITPPTLMAQHHSLYTQGLSHVNTGTYYLTQGIDNLDSDLIEMATDEFNTGSNYINQATALIS